MKLESQVVSLELSKRLKELGVKQESLYHWSHWEKGAGYGDVLFIWDGSTSRDDEFERVRLAAAFTVAELGEMLPMMTSWRFDGNNCCSSCARHTASGKALTVKFEANNHQTFADSEADARAKMLIHLIEKGLVKP